MSKRLTDEELLAKMQAHIRERKAVYDALDDDTNNRVIAQSEIESLQGVGLQNNHVTVNTNTIINEDKATRHQQLSGGNE